MKRWAHLLITAFKQTLDAERFRFWFWQNRSAAAALVLIALVGLLAELRAWNGLEGDPKLDAVSPATEAAVPATRVLKIAKSTASFDDFRHRAIIAALLSDENYTFGATFQEDSKSGDAKSGAGTGAGDSAGSFTMAFNATGSLASGSQFSGMLGTGGGGGLATDLQAAIPQGSVPEAGPTWLLLACALGLAVGAKRFDRLRR